MALESPILPFPRPRRVLGDFGGVYAAPALVAFLFSVTGPVAIILSIGAAGGLSEADISSWLFGGFFLNSILSLGFSIAYRQPLVFLWSIPGAVIVGPALTHLSFPEVIGAFLVSGIVMLLLGVSGWVRRAMDAVPMPIVMAMVAGVFLRFGVGLVQAFVDDLAIALSMTVTWLALSVWPRLKMPPLIGALVVGAVAIAVEGSFTPPAGALFCFAAPPPYTPPFSLPPPVALGGALVLTVLAL